MSFNVYYTNRNQLDSTAVDRVWYDNRDRELVLELHGVLYRYTDVPGYVYKELVQADSAGTYYQNNIRRNYGPATRLGPVSEANLIGAGAFAGQAEFRNLAVNGPVQVPSGGFVSMREAALKPLETPRLSLSKDVQSSEAYDHTVYFVLDGFQESAEKAHTFQATGVDDAIDKMLNLATLLDKTVIVKGVLVRF